MGQDKTWVQCLNCGHIYIIERKVSVGVSVIRSECPKCEWGKALNCGDKEEDVAIFYDPYLDERYFNY